MLPPDNIEFLKFNLDKVISWDGRVCLFVSKSKFKNYNFIEIDNRTNGALSKCINSREFDKLMDGDSLTLAYPVGIHATSIQLIKLHDRKNLNLSRQVGASVSYSNITNRVLFLFSGNTNVFDILFGYFLKIYSFDYYKKGEDYKIYQTLAMVNKPTDFKLRFQQVKAILEGVYFTRNLINEPANVLTTTEFSNRLSRLVELGLEVEILEEKQLYDLGMFALLAVGRGSVNPSKVAIIKWSGGNKKDKPLLLVGKGVVFDTGGVSLKPAAGMEEMTMDMGGAGVVSGVMKALALRRSKSNVIGLVGLVENMPDGDAQRPGDVVRSMKGDTIEVINTDAEGRLVLCDLLWYGQNKFSPCAIVDLATLTGAIIVALGNENAGVFSNNDEICNRFLKASQLEGEGAWHMPLSDNYKKLLKSRIADIANVGGRAAGACTAAKFLQHFITEGTPWIHIDIAGVAFSKAYSKLSSPGATGWGVASLNRFIADNYEAKQN